MSPPTPALAFLPALPLIPRPTLPPTPRRPPRPPRTLPRTPPTSLSTPPSPKVQIGSIVAIQLSSKNPTISLAQVTGVASSGDTIDIQPLEQFVHELYIPSKQPPTYIPSTQARPVPAQYVPSQRGWIILHQDLDVARDYFTANTTDLRARVRVVEPPKQPLSQHALKRQLFPRPTRVQAFVGAALSVPTAAVVYAAFAAARDAYRANPAGDGFLSGAVARQVVLFATAGASVGALIVGCALFFYALALQEDAA